MRTIVIIILLSIILLPSNLSPSYINMLKQSLRFEPMWEENYHLIWEGIILTEKATERKD